ncbi:hypothetical protein LI410_mgp094 (mitochondrion) [Apium graveolens]|uniref:hypothetical protein n=1 Tax=Apium graveolens TaxID=4045 RepID=UPI001D02F53E|nr:hypothetical protein LI410_mgp136 [Apium graveolens]YP_010185133.1 hypothetical protein LI410_mgp094 [Apium graveolens]QVJ97848.1 hypothetical protein [Apium graveolens]QVJ97890.1 hypothetical protein [Apium graveolens]QVJ97988.1 hypothetical protein [Apium graveolens]
MARKGNPISVRLEKNRSSDSSRFSEGDRESHQIGQSFPSVCQKEKKKGVGGRCRCPGRTRLLLTLEDHWKTPGTRACRERSTLGGGVLRPCLRGTVECRYHEREVQDTRPRNRGNPLCANR